MSGPNLIAVFNKLPKELFRLNNGPATRLRPWSPTRQYIFDIHEKNGLVWPKALNPSTYEGWWS
jgi:hypothetical protein